MKYISRSKGFTLIELLVVISIIGFLASAMSSSFAEARANARDAVRLQDMKNLERAFIEFYMDNQRYPNLTNDGVDLAGETLGVGNPIDVALAPYMDEIPRDPRHDAGTGLRPTSGALFYYSYDPSHQVSLEDCHLDTPPSFVSRSVYGFNSAEGSMKRFIETCHGSNVNLDNAHYNNAL